MDKSSLKAKSESKRATLQGADVVIVAAKNAYDEYKSLGAYICQPALSPLPEHPTRSFRTGIRRVAFYRNKQIEPEIPLIIEHYPSVPLTQAEAERLRSTGIGRDTGLAKVLDGVLEAGTRGDRSYAQVFLLSAPKDTLTIRLSQPISHKKASAWTQYQRYTLESALRTNLVTTENLAIAETELAGSVTG